MTPRQIFVAADVIVGLAGALLAFTAPRGPAEPMFPPQVLVGLALFVGAILAAFAGWEATVVRPRVATRDWSTDLAVLGVLAMQGTPLPPSAVIPSVDQPRSATGQPRGGTPVLTSEQRRAFLETDPALLRRHGVTSMVARCRHIADAPDPGTRHRVALYAPPPEYGPIRVLVALNGTRGPDGLHEHVLVLVEDRHTDPISAAAASYGSDVTPTEYLSLARRV